MEFRVIRWEVQAPPDEAELRKRLSEEGLSAYLWSNGPGYVYAGHTHSYDKVIYIVQGSIIWEVGGEGLQVETRAGDRIELPQGTLHAARVGPQGVACLEAHR